MRIDSHNRAASQGQAAVEFAIGVFILALLIAAFTELTPVMLRNLQLLSRARTEAGLNAISSTAATPAPGGTSEGLVVEATHHGFPVDTPANSWEYPNQKRPNNLLFANWRDNQVRALETQAGFTYEPYTLDFLAYLGVDESEVEHKIHEEVKLPPMEGL